MISENNGNRIRKLTPTGPNRADATNWTASTIAGPSPITSQGNSDGVGSAARFANPRGIAIAPSGEIYVADWGNHRIRRVTPAGSVTTVAGNVAGFGDSDTGTDAKFQSPTSVAVDSAGYVYVADSGNFLIRRVSPAGAVRTVAGAGVTGTSDGAGNTAGFTLLNAITVAASGDLMAGDASRIRTVQRRISNGGNP